MRWVISSPVEIVKISSTLSAEKVDNLFSLYVGKVIVFAVVEKGEKRVVSSPPAEGREYPLSL